jgi:8-oxo-dGTP pyrophosphatase MutT (NUDIX family)
MGHIHSDSEYDFTVTGNIVYRDTFLLIKHKFLPFWLPPGGHIELSETPIEALYKEIFEESGINQRDLTLIETTSSPSGNADGSIPLPYDINIHPIGDTGHQHIDLGYLLVSSTDQVNPGEDESQEWKWFTKSEIVSSDLVTPNVKKRAVFALEYVGEMS